MSQTINYDLGWIRQPRYDAIFRKSSEQWISTTATKEEKEKFRGANLGQLTLAVDVYISLLVEMEFPHEFVGTVITTLEREGLHAYCKYMSDIKNEWAHGASAEEAQSHLLLPRSYYDLCVWMFTHLTPQNINLVCSFMKRFTPDGAEVLRLKSLDDFKAREELNRKRTLSDDDSWFMKTEFSELVSAYIRYALSQYKAQATQYVTTNGVSNCCNVPLHRYVLANCRSEALIDYLFTTDDGQEFARGLLSLPYYAERPSNVGAVPKDYKSYRIITPEDPERLQIQEGERTAMLQSLAQNGLATNIPIENQDVMRELCRLSTVTKCPLRYATLDESAASDLITKRQLQEWVPELSPLVETLPKYCLLRKQKEDKAAPRKMWMLAPMGSNVTTVLQSIIFWAVDSAATDFFYCFASSRRPRKKLKALNPKHPTDAWTDTPVSFQDPITGKVFVLHPFQVFTMGDDQQVPTEAAETVMDFHTILGWKPNVSKSFYDEGQTYRESCGAEFFCGQDVSIEYWPRRPIRLVRLSNTEAWSLQDEKLRWQHTSERGGKMTNSITSLIGLQHRLVLMSFKNTANALGHWITQAYPKVTWSLVEEPTMDLWGFNLGKDPMPYPLAHCVALCARNSFTGELYTLDPEKKISPYTKVYPKWQYTESRDPRYTFYRDRHLCVKTSYKVKESLQINSCLICRLLSSHSDPKRIKTILCTYMRYTEFLRVGPSYGDPLSKLLKVSSRPHNPNEVAEAYLDYTF